MYIFFFMRKDMRYFARDVLNIFNNVIIIGREWLDGY